MRTTFAIWIQQVYNFSKYLLSFQIWIQKHDNATIYLQLIFNIIEFDISSLMNWIFFQVWNGFLQATQAVKIQFIWKFQTKECQKSIADTVRPRY